MTHSKLTRLILVLLVLGCLTTSCGMLLYPERRGQDSGSLDPVVVILDGIGLLFWVVPGLIAFGVDIYTGTIYEGPFDGGVVLWPPSGEQALLGVEFTAIEQHGG